MRRTSQPCAYLQGPQDGAGGVHEEEAQVAQHIGKGKQALGHQDGVEGVPVLPLRVVHVLELRDENERNEKSLDLRFCQRGSQEG